MQYDVTSLIRKLEPRWRALWRTPICEIVSARGASAAAHATLMRQHLRRWNSSRSLVDAADVVDAAIRTGDYGAGAAAALIIINDETARDSLKVAASRILRQTSDRPSSVLSPLAEWDENSLFPAIARLKRRLSMMPRDALTAMEIARLQSQVGQRKSAVRYVERALASAPNDRYILRSAVNFFADRSVKGDAPMVARAIATSDVVRHDPWVQAAEIAAANICGQTPRWALKARHSLDGPLKDPTSVSELAAGLAVLEQNAGAARRNVNRLVRTSLRSPTENALAQAVWSKRELTLELDVASHLTKIENAFEARARAAFEQKDYATAVEQSWEWLQDQHSSVSAAIYGASISTALLADYHKTLAFTTYGLKANPDNPMLLNGRLVALAYTGQLGEAEKVLSTLDAYEADAKFRPFVLAARGLLAFRRGSIAEGREWYTRTAEADIQSKQEALVANALMYWIEQELLAGTIEAEEANALVTKLDEKYSRKEYVGARAATWEARRKIIVNLINVATMKREVLSRYSRSNSIGPSDRWLVASTPED